MFNFELNIKIFFLLNIYFIVGSFFISISRRLLTYILLSTSLIWVFIFKTNNLIIVNKFVVLNQYNVDTLGLYSLLFICLIVLFWNWTKSELRSMSIFYLLSIILVSAKETTTLISTILLMLLLKLTMGKSWRQSPSYLKQSVMHIFIVLFLLLFSSMNKLNIYNIFYESDNFLITLISFLVLLLFFMLFSGITPFAKPFNEYLSNFSNHEKGIFLVLGYFPMVFKLIDILTYYLFQFSHVYEGLKMGLVVFLITSFIIQIIKLVKSREFNIYDIIPLYINFYLFLSLESLYKVKMFEFVMPFILILFLIIIYNHIDKQPKKTIFLKNLSFLILLLIILFPTVFVFHFFPLIAEHSVHSIFGYEILILLIYLVSFLYYFFHELEIKFLNKIYELET